jgi:hypothetical protein
MSSTVLQNLTVDGQIAFVLAAVILTVIGLVLMLWRPRHVTFRSHDCRALGCNWLSDSPKIR